MVNGLGNGSLKVGSNDWYALHNKADNLELQIKAYNRGMMGVLDGEKAVTRSEQAQNQPGINNANSTVGREQIQRINNPNSMVGVEANGNSNLVPIVGSLYVDTDTGETVDNYNYEGNGNSFAGDGGGGGGAGGSWGSEGYSIPDGNGGGGGGAGGSWVDGTNVDDELLRSLIETTLNDNVHANIQFVQNDGGTDLPSNTTYLRLIDKDGEYVFTPNNPLSQITPLLG